MHYVPTLPSDRQSSSIGFWLTSGSPDWGAGMGLPLELSVEAVAAATK